VGKGNEVPFVTYFVFVSLTLREYGTKSLKINIIVSYCGNWWKGGLRGTKFPLVERGLRGTKFPLVERGLRGNKVPPWDFIPIQSVIFYRVSFMSECYD
jgi:hypothetical protein